MVAGAITGALVFGKKGTVDDHCDSQLTCEPDGLEAANSAKTLGLVSTISFGVGIAGLAAGAVLFLTAPSPTSAAASPKTKTQKAATLSGFRWEPAGTVGQGDVAVGVKGAW